MIVCDPVERDPWVEPLHDSCRVDVVDPEERLREAEVTGGASHERAAERLVGDRDRPFETKRQRGGWVGHVQAFADTPDASTRNRPVVRASPRLRVRSHCGSATGRLTKRTLCARARRDMYW